MPARATSSGTISFGLVSIPIKLYSAAQPKSVRFHMLHATDHSRVKQQLVCATCGEVVERSDTVKGYEHTRDQYVVMEPDELTALDGKSDRTIEIEDFVPISEVDPVYFERPNLLGPDKGGQKAYKLLAESMTATQKVAIGRFATRGKHQLVLIRPVGNGLMMHGLHYADEVRSFDDIEFGDPVELKDGEIDLANQLIEQLSRKDFDPTGYEDEYRRDVLQAIDRKVAGQEIVAMPAPQQREQIIDLVAALKKSLADKSGEKPGRKPAKAKGKKAAARKVPSRKRASS